MTYLLILERQEGEKNIYVRHRHRSLDSPVRPLKRGGVCNHGRCPGRKLHSQPFRRTRRGSKQLSNPARAIIHLTTLSFVVYVIFFPITHKGVKDTGVYTF